MANIKISDLTPAAAVLGTQEFEVNDSLTSKKVTAAQMLSYINANSGAVDLTSAQTITGVKTFSQPIVGSVTGSAATATTAGNITGTAAVGNGGTGRTSLTANNILIGAGTSAVNFVAPGTSGNVLTSNGTTWTSAAPGGGAADVQTFNANGTWTKPSTGTMARIQVWGGGGGGSRNSSTNSSGGGGGGGYNELTLPLSSFPSSVTVTIGAGGAGRTASTGVGSNGGASNFGDILGATGGGASGVTTSLASGPGGFPFVGDLTNFVASNEYPSSTLLWRGDAHETSNTIPNIFGALFGGGAGASASGSQVTLGRSSGYGGKGGDGGRSTTGIDGTAPGGGGGGRNNGADGGNGAAGRVIVTVW